MINNENITSLSPAIPLMMVFDHVMFDLVYIHSEFHIDTDVMFDLVYIHSEAHMIRMIIMIMMMY